MLKRGIVGGFLASCLIYYIIFHLVHIPEGVEDRNQLYSTATVRRFWDDVTSALFYLGKSDIFSATRAIVGQAIATIPEGVAVEEGDFDGIRVKVYRPSSTASGPLPAFIYIHGGGLVFGSPEYYNYVTGYLAKEVGMVVVSVSYRLAPEHLYPAQSDDVLKATEYLLQHCSEWGVDASKIFMGGDSAGGLLTAVTTIRLIRKNLPKPRAIVLIYPLLQVISYSTPSYIQNADDFYLRRSLVPMFRLVSSIGRSQELFKAFSVNNFTSPAIRKQFADKFDLPELANRGPPHFDQDGDPDLINRFLKTTDELMSPLLSSIIEQFPPTLFIVCEFDILRDDSVMMARRLRKSGVPVEYHSYYSFHGMITLAEKYRPAARALKAIANYIRKSIS